MTGASAQARIRSPSPWRLVLRVTSVKVDNRLRPLRGRVAF